MTFHHNFGKRNNKHLMKYVRDVIGSHMQRWGTIIQFMFGNIYKNKVLHQQAKKTVILGASPKWPDLEVPMG